MPPDTVNPLNQLLPFILIIFIFYFIVIKPEKGKKQELKKMIDNLKKNDQIITIGGIHATVINVKETTLIARIDENVKIEIDKEAVTTVKSNKD